MPRKYDTVKASSLYETPKAKWIEWVPQKYSWGFRDVPVEVTAEASQPRPRKKSRRQPREENNVMPQGEAASQFIDVDETFQVEEPIIPTGEKRVRQLKCSSMNLTYVPVPGYIHQRIYPQDRSLLTLPTWFWGRSGNDYLPELQVCSVWVEVLRLLSCTCTLQGVLLKVTPAAPLSQSSKMGWNILCAVVVVGGWGVFEIRALGGFMPKSTGEWWSPLCYNPISWCSYRWISIMGKNVRAAVTTFWQMNVQRLSIRMHFSWVSAAQDLVKMTKMATQ